MVDESNPERPAGGASAAKPAWSFEHSVLARVPLEDAWSFWTDVGHWSLDTSVEWVRLDGPFAAGTYGTTKPRAGEPIRWLIEEAETGRATIRIDLPGALVRFDWSFIAETRTATRLTQRVALTGEKASDYLAIAQSELAAGIPLGMAKLAEAMERLRQAPS